MEVQGKENSSVVKVSERTKPTFVTVGNKQIISTGRWNNELMADHVSEHGRGKWLRIGELARVARGSNTIANKRYVRSRLSRLFLELLNRGELLVVEYNGDHYGASAVKIADVASKQDRVNVNE